ncbi:S8 family peptidase [Actinacidiphila sp. bgisy167]|uniref:S8 family peptidase n=1 Tax=Actinacidiphila sp. bgisy167 TaxID=3413797 RepID=UPI003D715309
MNEKRLPGIPRPRPRHVAATAIVALLAGLTATPGVAQGLGPDARQADPGARGTAGSGAHGLTQQQVTLITGDRVTLDTDPTGKQSVLVEPAKGREHIRFVKRQDGDDWTVIPVDALPLLAADRLDRALFNVSALVKGKYAERKSLPLIVQYTGDAATAERRLAAAGAGEVDAIAGTSFASVVEPQADAGDFWKGIAPGQAGVTALGSGVSRIWLDGRAKVQLDVTVPHIGAPHAWEKGYTGKGVKVAVLDTGFDPNHPDLKGVVTESANFTTEPNTDDLAGHGTHVASTVAGSGAASGGRYKGVAPGAQILLGKVCTGDGNCEDSDIIEGLAWAAQRGAKVISLSLGDVDTPETDAVEAMVDAVSRDYGALVVAAAGNDGDSSRVASPASADRALAVGASQEDDDRAGFSNVGPREGDSGLKPDLIAPGVNVVAAMAGGTTADDGYVAMSGTSMATPHVSGAAAILFQQHPDWTAEQVKRQLMQSTDGAMEHGAYYQGAGRLDVGRAVDQEVTADTAGLDFGLVKWTGGTRPPATRTITYRNSGAAPVTLRLTQHASRGIADTPAPEGLFRLGADTVTVPAHGTAGVTVTATPEAAGTQYAAYSGVVSAATADGGVSVRVPLGMDVEQPSHELRVTMKNSAGKTPEYAYLLFSSADGQTREVEVFGTDSVARRLPVGTYSVSGFFFEGDFTKATVVGEPQVVMTADRSVTIDARKAKPVTVSAPSRTARIITSEIGTIGLGNHLLSITANEAVGDDHIENVYAVPTTRSKDSAFTYMVSSTWGEPAPGGGVNPASVYYLTRPVHGSIPADPGYEPRRSELTTVNTTFAATAKDSTGARNVYMYVDDQRFRMPTLSGLRVPDRRVDYFSSADGLRWQSSFDQTDLFDADAPRGQAYMSTIHGYRAGAKVEEHWNQAVQGVGFSPEGMDTYREGGDMYFALQEAANGDLGLVAMTNASSEQKFTFTRNGEEVPYFYGYAAVPEDTKPADYRLTLEQDRDLAPASLVSTHLRAEWQFRSQTPKARQALPLYAVRMAPELDEWNRAEAGHKLRIPVLIQRAVGAADTPIRTFTAEVSFDEGRTWQTAKSTGSGTERTVTVDHPRHVEGGSVSLRTFVKDADGNSFKQTVIKAYLLK